MERLWGEFLPVPCVALQVLVGGETRQRGGHEIDVAYTPGHASHHVCYFDRPASRSLATQPASDAASAIVMPPTPPPDVDLETWRTSEEASCAGIRTRCS